MIEAVKELQLLEEERQMEGTDELEEESKERPSLSLVSDGLLAPRISVFGTVRKLREQRWSMVKNQSQYNFLYSYMNMWARHELKNNMILEDILFNFGHTPENQLSDHESMQM